MLRKDNVHVNSWYAAMLKTPEVKDDYSILVFSTGPVAENRAADARHVYMAK